MAGTEMGTMILIKIPKCPKPSTLAAPIRSPGIVRYYCLKKNTIPMEPSILGIVMGHMVLSHPICS